MPRVLTLITQKEPLAFSAGAAASVSAAHQAMPRMIGGHTLPATDEWLERCS